MILKSPRLNLLLQHISILLIFSVLTVYSLKYLLIDNPRHIVRYVDILGPPNLLALRIYWNSMWPVFDNVFHFLTLENVLLHVISDTLTYQHILFFLRYYALLCTPYVLSYILCKRFLTMGTSEAILVSSLMGVSLFFNPIITRDCTPPNWVCNYVVLLMINYVLILVLFHTNRLLIMGILTAIFISITISYNIRLIEQILLEFVSVIIGFIIYKPRLRYHTKTFIVAITIILAVFGLSLHWLLPLLSVQLLKLNVQLHELRPYWSFGVDYAEKLCNIRQPVFVMLGLLPSAWLRLHPLPALGSLGYTIILAAYTVLPFVLLAFCLNILNTLREREKGEFIVHMLISSITLYIFSLLFSTPGLNASTCEVFKHLFLWLPPNLIWIVRYPGFFDLTACIGHLMILLTCLSAIVLHRVRSTYTSRPYVLSTTFILVICIVVLSLITGWQKLTGDLDGKLRIGYDLKADVINLQGIVNDSLALDIRLPEFYYIAAPRSILVGTETMDISFRNYIVHKYYRKHDENAILNVMKATGRQFLIVNQISAFKPLYRIGCISQQNVTICVYSLKSKHRVSKRVIPAINATICDFSSNLITLDVLFHLNITSMPIYPLVGNLHSLRSICDLFVLEEIKGALGKLVTSACDRIEDCIKVDLIRYINKSDPSNGFAKLTPYGTIWLLSYLCSRFTCFYPYFIRYPIITSLKGGKLVTYFNIPDDDDYMMIVRYLTGPWVNKSCTLLIENEQRKLLDKLVLILYTHNVMLSSSVLGPLHLKEGKYKLTVLCPSNVPVMIETIILLRSSTYSKLLNSLIDLVRDNYILVIPWMMNLKMHKGEKVILRLTDIPLIVSNVDNTYFIIAYKGELILQQDTRPLYHSICENTCYVRFLVSNYSAISIMTNSTLELRYALVASRKALLLAKRLAYYNITYNYIWSDRHELVLRCYENNCKFSIVLPIRYSDFWNIIAEEYPCNCNIDVIRALSAGFLSIAIKMRYCNESKIVRLYITHALVLPYLIGRALSLTTLMILGCITLVMVILSKRYKYHHNALMKNCI